MIYIRSLLFNICFFITMTAISIACLIAGYIYGYKGINKMGVCASWIIEKLLKYISGITTEFRDQHLVPQDGQFIAACKHQSAWETVSLHRFVPDPTVIMKAELGKIPIFGQVVVKAGSILIDRKKGNQAAQIIKGAQKSLEQHRPIFIFPEGTRSVAGQPGKYKSGIFRMYHELNIPVLPIALNSGYFWPRRGFLKRPGHLVVHFLPLIQPGLSEQEFMKTLETTIEEACANIAPPSSPLNNKDTKTQNTLSKEI